MSQGSFPKKQGYAKLILIILPIPVKPLLTNRLAYKKKETTSKNYSSLKIVRTAFIV
jgi:hypothetical protein